MHKILFAGPVGAGKSSAIAAVSDSRVLQTDARASDETVLRKPRTTVAMDYGTLRIDENLTIQLIGVPGQSRFDFMWEILAQGAIGLVLLIDHGRPEPISDLKLYLDVFSGIMKREGAVCVVGITRCDLATEVSIEPYQRYLDDASLSIPVFEVDARSRSDIKTLLMALAAMLNPRSQRTQSGAG